MAEPLTKDKLFCAGCNCKEDNHPNVGHHYVGLTSIEDLKSALEEFEELLDIGSVVIDPNSITGKKIKSCLKKAFPAIYESEVER